MDLEIIQFDNKTAFFYGELTEDICMKIPEGLQLGENENQLVCKLTTERLNKSLYGLKQAPRCWNIKFCNFLDYYDFRSSNADKCIYRGVVDNCDVYLAIFVDNGLIASKS